jgi:hypothetical protein
MFFSGFSVSGFSFSTGDDNTFHHLVFFLPCALIESKRCQEGPMAKGCSLLLLFLCSCLLPTPGFALEITAVAPGTVSPDSIVTVSGGPFQPNVRVILGGQSIVPKVVGDRQLVFSVPPLEEGEYSLFVQQGEESSGKAFTLRIVFPPPRITSINPTNIDECSSEAQRQVVVVGENFQPGANLLLDNGAIPHSQSGGQTITFTAPALPAGIYGVQVVNSDGRRSLPHSLWFNNVPEITSVTQGQDFTTYYQLIISGKNFQFNSTLVVNEYPIDTPDVPPQQRSIPVRRQGMSIGVGDNVFFTGCDTLVYNRYPTSSQIKQLTLQVINPDGRATSAYTLSAP